MVCIHCSWIFSALRYHICLLYHNIRVACLFLRNSIDYPQTVCWYPETLLSHTRLRTFSISLVVLLRDSLSPCLSFSLPRYWKKEVEEEIQGSNATFFFPYFDFKIGICRSIFYAQSYTEASNSHFDPQRPRVVLNHWYKVFRFLNLVLYTFNSSNNTEKRQT